MTFKIQQRRDTAAHWTAGNPTLSQGEVGLETDTGKFKFGDGTTAWTGLGYSASGGGVTSFQTRTGVVTLSKSDVTGTGLAAADVGAAPATGIAESAVTNLTTDLAAKAPVASPTFTGTVTVPTGAALGTPASATLTNATGLPESGVINLTTDLAAKAPLVSPSFTTPVLGTPTSGNLANCTFPTLNQNTSGTAANLSGTPALPNGTAATTQTALDNSTKIATTAYADTAVGVETASRLKGIVTVVSVSGTYAILTTDTVIFCNASSAGFTATLPTAVGVTGKVYTIKKTDTSLNAVTVATTSSQTIDLALTSVIATPGESITVVSDNANWKLI